MHLPSLAAALVLNGRLCLVRPFSSIPPPCSSSSCRPTRRHRPMDRRSPQLFGSPEPSTVIDEDGPTPEPPQEAMPIIDPDDIPELRYDKDAHPIPHQPWRRGDTDGCEDPIFAPWRTEAEEIIRDAAAVVGADVEDVTWYMAKCVITLGEDLSRVSSYHTGPEVRVHYPSDDDIRGHVWEDPDIGTDKERILEEDELLEGEQYDEETEYEILKSKQVDEYDPETGEVLPKEDIRPRDERMRDMTEEERLYEEGRPREERPVPDKRFGHGVDTLKISTIAQSILAALNDEDVEERLGITSRHEIILTSPTGNPAVLETQQQFDDARDLDVFVHTRDPWGSNRTLKGKLVDRNALDIIININGRMVTVPQSMCHQVVLPSAIPKLWGHTNALEDMGYEEEYYEEEEYEEEEEEEGEEYEEEE